MFLELLRPGDTLVVMRIVRPARSIGDHQDIVRPEGHWAAARFELSRIYSEPTPSLTVISGLFSYESVVCLCWLGRRSSSGPIDMQIKHLSRTRVGARRRATNRDGRSGCLCRQDSASQPIEFAKHRNICNP